MDLYNKENHRISANIFYNVGKLKRKFLTLTIEDIFIITIFESMIKRSIYTIISSQTIHAINVIKYFCRILESSTSKYLKG